MPGLTMKIPHKSDVEKAILGEIRQRVKSSQRRLQDYEAAWRAAEEKILAYLPERQVDSLRRTSRENGLPQYTTIQIPYSYAVLLSAHTYFTSVFLGRNPVLQYSARHGESMQQVQAVEALHDYQMLVGSMLGPFYTWLYDAGKYGLGVVGNYWEDRYDHISQITSQPVLDILGNPTGATEKIRSTHRARTYSGNTLYNLQPWDFLFDVRYSVRDFQRGEYCGCRRKLSWNEIKRREANGYYMNIAELAQKYSPAPESITSQGSDQLNRPDTFEQVTGEDRTTLTMKHPAQVGTYEMFVELIPKDWRLGPSDYPEKWVFTVPDDYSVLMGAQPHGALHCKYPYSVLTMEPEAYGLIPRGMPQVLEPVQNTIDWLLNSHFYNVRAALNNRVIVDPSRVVMKDVMDPLPGGVIRLKPEAYGTGTEGVVTQMQVTDVTQNHLRDLQMMYGIGERAVGVNEQIMGALNTGGRKTATEIRTSTTFGVNRLKTVSEYFSATGVDPLSQMLLQNTQQYYDQEQKFRIAGDLMNGAGQGFMMVNPESILGFYDFVPVDGTFPIDRYAQANLWRELMAQVRQMPEIALQYDFGRMFEWVAQLAGLKNITQFRTQVVPDQQAMMQAKLGNIVPLGGGRQPRRSQGSGGQPGGVPEPGQVGGNGPTG